MIRLLEFKLMYIEKENLHPNIAHLIRQKRSLEECSGGQKMKQRS